MLNIEYSEYATKQIDEIYSHYGIYNQNGNFSQQFINWNDEFHRYVNSKEISKKHLYANGIYIIGTIGALEYNLFILNDAKVFEIVEFRFAKLPYVYKITDDAGYGYKIIKSTLNGLFSILTPQRTQLTNFKFDNIIGFHHSTEDYNVIHAIGFIGDRVYEIMLDGTIQVLHMSRTDYLNQKHRYDECKKRFMHYLIENKQNKTYRTMNRIRLTESQLHSIIRRCINEAMDEISTPTIVRAHQAAKQKYQSALSNGYNHKNAEAEKRLRQMGSFNDEYNRRTKNCTQCPEDMSEEEFQTARQNNWK